MHTGGLLIEPEPAVPIGALVGGQRVAELVQRIQVAGLPWIFFSS
jgi:hypothetical protein